MCVCQRVRLGRPQPTQCQRSCGGARHSANKAGALVWSHLVADALARGHAHPLPADLGLDDVPATRGKTKGDASVIGKDPGKHAWGASASCQVPPCRCTPPRLRARCTHVCLSVCLCLWWLWWWWCGDEWRGCGAQGDRTVPRDELPVSLVLAQHHSVGSDGPCDGKGDVALGRARRRGNWVLVAPPNPLAKLLVPSLRHARHRHRRRQLVRHLLAAVPPSGTSIGPGCASGT